MTVEYGIFDGRRHRSTHDMGQNSAGLTDAQRQWLSSALGFDVPQESGGVGLTSRNSGKADAEPSAGGAQRIGVPEGKLREFARWPEEAHTAWKSLSGQERVEVLFAMASRYGPEFAKQFEGFTKSGNVRHDSIHYGPDFPEHTKEWFEKRGYKLAMKDSVHEWWVHPNGHEIMAAIDQPKTEPKQQPERDQPEELLRMTLEIIRQDLEEDGTRRLEAEATKREIDKLNVSSPEFAAGYANYVKALDEGKRRTAEQLSDIEDALESLKQMHADVSAVEQGWSDVQEAQNWFEAERDILDKAGRKPIDLAPIDSSPDDGP